MRFGVCGAFWQLRKVDLHFFMPSWVFPVPVHACVRQRAVSSLSASFLSIGNTVYPKYDSKFSLLMKRANVKENFWEPNGANELLLWLLEVSSSWSEPVAGEKEEKGRVRPIHQSFPPTQSIWRSLSNSVCREKLKLWRVSQVGRRGTEDVMPSHLLKWNPAILSRVTTSWLAGGVTQQGRSAFREFEVRMGDHSFQNPKI